MSHTPGALLDWLHQLDSYTNATYGRARSLSAVRLECVSCARPATAVDAVGRCRRCAAERASDRTPVSAAWGDRVLLHTRPASLRGDRRRR